MKQKKKTAGTVRKTVQLLVFLLVALIAAGKWLSELGIGLPPIPAISLHAVCPFGGVETLYQFLTTGTFVQKIHNASFLLMLLGIVVALLFGTVFCGYVCPLGTFQEWIGKLGQRLFPKRYNHSIPEKADRFLGFLRYAVLALVLFETARASKLVFESVDPYYALFHFFTGEVAWPALLVLAAVALASLLVERPWCRYLCPYGAFLGLFNRVRLFSIRRNADTCIGCKKCDMVCPMGIRVSGRTAVRDARCISCHRCTSEEACPVRDTVVIAAGRLKTEEKEGAGHEA